LLYFVSELVARFASSDRHRDDDTFRPLQFQSGDGCPHRGTGCQAVVDQDNGAISNVRARPIASKGSFAARKLADFFGCHCFHNGLRNPESLEHVWLHDSHIPAGHCAHGQFFLPRNAQLSNYENVQRQFQSSCNFARNRNPAAR
jgi:hypothetical protein